MKKTSTSQIASEYAQALYDAAYQQGTLEDVRHDCEVLSDTLRNISELNLLNNPAWKTAEKKQVVSEIVAKLQLSQTTASFWELVVANRRLNHLPKILVEFAHIFYREQGIAEVLVGSVQPLTATQDKKLRGGLEKLLKQKIVITYNINPELLGGLVIEYGSMRIDDSILGKLSRLEQVMKGNL